MNLLFPHLVFGEGIVKSKNEFVKHCGQQLQIGI